MVLYSYKRIMIILLLVCLPVNALAITYDISWVGSNGYEMTGLFSYSDAFIDSGLINEGQIDEFRIEGFHNDTSIGSWDLDAGSASIYPFNFNFDTTTESFLVGGVHSGPMGQSWNYVAGTFGFASGLASQVVSLDSSINESLVEIPSSALNATVRTVPFPAAVWLFGSGLLTLIGFSKCGKKL